MTADEFQDQVIEDGIAAARESYAKPEQAHKLEGAVAGFEACRGKSPAELLALLEDAGRSLGPLMDGPIEDYWRAVCYRGEVEWVCNTVSAAMATQGLPPIIPPTVRGVLNAGRILNSRPSGVSSEL